MLALDHGGQIIPQEDLAAGGILRGDDVDGLVGVHIGKAVLGQLIGQAGADDLSAVQAEDGIHDGAVLVGRHQLLGHSLAQRAFACSGRAVHGHGIYAHSSPSPFISAAAIPAARPVDQAICRLNPPV